MMLLGEILLRKKWISSLQLEEILGEQGQRGDRRPLGELLLEKGWLQEEQLQQALKEQYWRRNGYWLID